MLAHVQKKLDRGLEFTDEGWRELSRFHASVLTNARMAFNVLVSRDPETARQLVEEKDRLRDAGKSKRARATSCGCAKARRKASRQAPSTSTRSAT